MSLVADIGDRRIDLSRTLKRIFREYSEIETLQPVDWSANPLDLHQPYEWHFTLMGPSDSEFSSGIYHGKFTLPVNYPMAPPVIMLLTPNGRFETNTKICLSISNYHPELWQPAWGIRTMVEALRSFFPTPAAGAVGGLDWPEDLRRKLAEESVTWRCEFCQKCNRELLERKENHENEQHTDQVNITDDSIAQGPPCEVSQVDERNNVEDEKKLIILEEKQKLRELREAHQGRSKTRLFPSLKEFMSIGWDLVVIILIAVLAFIAFRFIRGRQPPMRR